MTERENVIKTLNDALLAKENYHWAKAEMSFNFIRMILSLLKEQEAEWIYGEDETGVDGWHCSECNFFEPWFYEFDDNIDFIKRYEHCPKCGRRMTSYTGKQEGR